MSHTSEIFSLEGGQISSPPTYIETEMFLPCWFLYFQPEFCPFDKDISSIFSAFCRNSPTFNHVYFPSSIKKQHLWDTYLYLSPTEVNVVLPRKHKKWRPTPRESDEASSFPKRRWELSELTSFFMSLVPKKLYYTVPS